MFGQQVSQIIKGHTNEFLNKEADLYNYRKPICNSCKLKVVKNILGANREFCNDSLYLNPITNEISHLHKEGYSKGCGCALEASTRVKSKMCPVGKW